MPTYNSLRDRVVSYCIRDGDPAFLQEVDNFLLLAEARIRHDLRLSRSVVTTTLEDVSTNQVTAPADSIEIVGVTTRNSQGGHRLDRLPSRVLRGLPVFGNPGEVELYAVEGQNLLFGPTPSGVTMDISYYPLLPGLSSTQDANVISNEAFHVLLYCVLAEAFFWLHDMDMYAICEKKYVEFKTQYEVSDAHRESPGASKVFPGPEGP